MFKTLKEKTQIAAKNFRKAVDKINLELNKYFYY